MAEELKILQKIFDMMEYGYGALAQYPKSEKFAKEPWFFANEKISDLVRKKSQVTANIVMTPVDHYMKREVRIPYYIRYMDDMILMAPSKGEVREALELLDNYLQENMGLQLNNKTAIMPYDAGVEFVGKRIWPHKIEIRRSTTLQMKRHLKYVMEHYAKGELTLEYARSVLFSYLGMMKHCNCDALRKKILEWYVLVRKSE